MTVQETLKARNNVHGDFTKNAACAQALKHVLENYGDKRPTDLQLEALDLICTKISRIITGDHNFPDHWHDIAGYAMLAERDLLNGLDGARVEGHIPVVGGVDTIRRVDSGTKIKF